MPVVTAVSLRRGHHFSKTNSLSIRLLKGLGVDGDAHMGGTVKHRSRVAKDPSLPNLRQVHLLHEELFDELAPKSFIVRPGEMGENVTTRGIDLVGLPRGTRLHLGAAAVVELTGLRNPCIQLDRWQQGLMRATLEELPDGQLLRKAGVMGIVVAGGDVRPGDAVRAELPVGPHEAMKPV